MATKFGKEAEKQVIELQALVNRSIRSALLAGLLAATKFTKHDSSNAANHWMIAAGNGAKSKPWNRRLGKIRDLRGSYGKRGTAVSPEAPVGYQRDKGKNKTATMRFVRDRELREVVEKFVVGRNPETEFYFYNAAGGDETYEEHANIDTAGKEAVKRALVILERSLAAGKGRKTR